MTTPNYDTPEPLPGDGEQSSGHEYFAELCALSTSGSLEWREWSQLRSHLQGCRDCRQATAEFRFVATEGMPLLADGDAIGPQPDDPAKGGLAWSRDEIKQTLLSKTHSTNVSEKAEAASGIWHSSRAELPLVGWPGWERVAQYGAVGLCLFVAVGVGGYRLGLARVRATQPIEPYAVSQPSEVSLEAESGAAIDNLHLELEQRDGVAQKLKQRLAQSESLRTAQSRELDQALTQSESLRTLRDTLVGVVNKQDAALTSLQHDIDVQRTQDQDHLLHIFDLRAQLETQSKSSSKHQVNVVPESVPQAPQASVSDNDLRELMGARNLYLTDVVDVDNNGHTRQPFGRIFYTTGKSLIFYAFDLDQQRGLRNSAFQLWGQRGSNQNDYINMGVFNLDSETNRRWVLKFDDPQKLAQINAVFVTIEPIGGSHRPAGKQLLYASIRTLPNHP
jgi:hypothetical protein